MEWKLSYAEREEGTPLNDLFNKGNYTHPLVDDINFDNTDTSLYSVTELGSQAITITKLTIHRKVIKDFGRKSQTAGTTHSLK